MNIKAHIEAGHYPTDEKGRALVPLANGGTATIYATDHTDGGLVIVGRIFVAGENHLQMWDRCGRLNRLENQSLWLCPPPPRKVKVTAYGLAPTSLSPSRNVAPTFYGSEDAARSAIIDHSYWRVVELTGEYEEPWS